MSTSEKRPYHPYTRLIHGRMHSRHWQYDDHIVPPISSSAAYRLESAARGAEGFIEFANPEFNSEQQAPIYIYDRLDEPIRGMLEENLAVAEGGDRVRLLRDRHGGHQRRTGRPEQGRRPRRRPRDALRLHVLSVHELVPAARDRRRLRRPARSRDAVEAAMPALNTMVVYFETPVNPTLELIDIRAIAGPRSRRPTSGGPTRRRRIFPSWTTRSATPFWQRPLAHGADIVVHSLTKNLDGFGTDMGGAVVCEELIHPDLLLYRKDFGGAARPQVGLAGPGLRSAHAARAHAAPAGDGAEGGRVPGGAPHGGAGRLPRAPHRIRSTSSPSGRCGTPTATSPRASSSTSC